MNQDLLSQIAQQQGRALDLLAEKPMTPTRRKLIERHLAINERLMDAAIMSPAPATQTQAGNSPAGVS
jgi:hypothetical protein